MLAVYRLTCFPLGQISQHFSEACPRRIHLKTTIKAADKSQEIQRKRTSSDKRKECDIKGTWALNTNCVETIVKSNQGRARSNARGRKRTSSVAKDKWDIVLEIFVLQDA